MSPGLRSCEGLRSQFDLIYDTQIIGRGFVEQDDYYRLEKERYWRSLTLLTTLNIPAPAKILEIGGGQLALLCKLLFGDDCTVGDISNEHAEPLSRVDIPHVTFNLMDPDAGDVISDKFDLIILLEVIEHIPTPAHVTIGRLKPLFKPDGLLFMSTPNLFRLRNLIRMALGIEFLDRFTVARPGQGLGHQLEYSADHLRWQLEQAGMSVIMLKHDRLGHVGHSFMARLARFVLSPLDFRPIWRDSLVVAARFVS